MQRLIKTRMLALLAVLVCTSCASSVTAQVLSGINASTVTRDILNSVELPKLEELTEAAKSGRWTPAETLQVGEAFEKTRQWPQAIRVYEASQEFKADESVKYALRRTRVHYAIDRRYADRSFDRNMLAQSRSEALDLLEDVMTRVQMEYVDEVTPTRFIAHGTESLYMALANERFRKEHLRGKPADAIDRIRTMLVSKYWNKRVSSRVEARMVVSEVCDAVQRDLGIRPTAVIHEYLFGGCNALDDYSNFLTPDRYNDLFGSIQGEFVGIGIEMEAEKGKGMHLVNVLMDSPAEDGGLRPGDHIVEIDGKDCRDLTTDEAASLLRGTQGSRVSLRFASPDGSTQRSTLTRRPVQVRSVARTMILDDYEGIGYIQMTGFQSSTEEELDAALRDLERQGMKKLIWDLRGNPGGLLDTAAAVIDRFIDDGVLVSTEGRASGQTQYFRAHSGYTRNLPLVLLVDENSASASEIVAGAIKDHDRGQIVGRKTYGKWSVQSIIHLPGNTGLKLTTAKFFSPNHMNYAGKGLAPHVTVDVPDETRRTMFRARTSTEIMLDPDVSKAMELLEARVSRKN